MGSALFAIGTFFVGIATIGRCWSLLYVAGYKNDTLITVGPYSITRNPLYFFTLVGAIGVALVTRTFTFVALGALWFWVFYPGVLRAEEQRLAALHGGEFEEYRRRVPRFWPRLHAALVEPEEYMVCPVPFRKRLVDGLWFVWALGIVELVEALHRVFPGSVILFWY
ncbi:MAG TPA: isoprenylcysteine carboxylmethyltransferase family protein [Burkholderiales bacterium]|nr:isoprenylcysteine carboxylmethyltransferase family protein [Burkholderiales bacterium]